MNDPRKQASKQASKQAVIGSERTPEDRHTCSPQEIHAREHHDGSNGEQFGRPGRAHRAVVFVVAAELARHGGRQVLPEDDGDDGLAAGLNG
jgi:hypothetical protein